MGLKEKKKKEAIEHQQYLFKERETSSLLSCFERIFLIRTSPREVTCSSWCLKLTKKNKHEAFFPQENNLNFKSIQGILQIFLLKVTS